jgi:hypothetical protein
MKKLLIIAIVFIINIHAIAQKINPDLKNIQVKSKSTLIYKSQNSSEDLKSVKATVDSRGNQYVLFCDGNLGSVYLSTFKNGTWQTNLLPKGYFNDESIRYVAMDIDKNDGLHIIVVGYPGTLYYGYKNTLSDWKFTEISKDKMSWLHNFYIFQEYIDLAVDKNMGVHIIAKADIDSKGHSSIYFYKAKDGEWTSEIVRQGISDTEKDYGNEPSIAIAENRVMVSFGGNWSLSYAEKNIGSTVWKVNELIKSDKNMDASNGNTSITLTENNSPVISFRNYKSGDLRGVNVLTQSKCTGKWSREAIGNESSSGSAIVSNKDVLFLAYCDDGGFTKVAYRTCDCDQVWKTIYNVQDESKIFMDMIVDIKNHTHLFYSTYNDEIKQVEFWFDGNPEIDCNYFPSIYFKGKTNVQPGEEWSAKLYANDPECDPTNIYSIILPDGFELTDHSNGSATIKGKISESDGEGEISIVVLCNDNKHPGNNASQSKVAVKLRITQDGKEKGNIKYENSCVGKKSKEIVSSLSGTETGAESEYKMEAKPSAEKESDSNINSAVSETCKEYLDRYEIWADKYVPLKKRVNNNPMDMDAVMKIAHMATEIGNWALEWSKLYECSNDEGFQNRYESITAKIDEVNK